MHAIGQEQHEHLAVGVEPDRRARVAGVSVRAGIEELAGAASAVARVPAEGAGARRALREQRDHRIADDSNAVVLAAVQHHLREDRQVRGGAEEPRVPGDAAQGVRVLVVHLATDRVAAGRRDLGGGDAIRHGVRRLEERVVHAERLEDAVVQEMIERLTGDGLDDEAEDVGAQVGVDEALPGAAGEIGGEHRGARLFGRASDAPEVTTRGEPGAVREELTNGDGVLRATGECGKIGVNRGVEIELALVEQDHGRGGRPDDFRERREVVDRPVRTDPGAARGPPDLAEPLLEDGVAAATDDDRGAGVPSRLDAALDDAVDGRESGGGHANRLRRVDRQTVGRGQRDVRAEKVVNQRQLLGYNAVGLCPTVRQQTAVPAAEWEGRLRNSKARERVQWRAHGSHITRRSLFTYQVARCEVPWTTRLTRPTVTSGASHVKTKGCRDRHRSADVNCDVGHKLLTRCRLHG